jgi:hypothetical protein
MELGSVGLGRWRGAAAREPCGDEPGRVVAPVVVWGSHRKADRGVAAASWLARCRAGRPEIRRPGSRLGTRLVVASPVPRRRLGFAFSGTPITSTAAAVVVVTTAIKAIKGAVTVMA